MLGLKSVLTLAASLALLTTGEAFGKFGDRHRHHKAKAAESFKAQQHRQTLASNQTDYRFYNNVTAPYFVKSLPEVDYDLGETYSGLVPLVEGNDTRSLFFIFQPKIGEPVDELTIWLNGGPGCSSLEGFFQENGKYIWPPGTYKPYQNQYSWVNLTNMIWVEQPIGTGYTQGKPTATTQEETAQDFIKFFKNFQTIFGIKNFKIYVTGESYAGRYVPYISAAMLDQNNTEYFDLSGALVYDPCIGEFDYVQEEVVTVPFVLENKNLFNFNETFLQNLTDLHESCGYADYIDKYFTFPPSGVQPVKYFNYTSEASCDVFDLVDFAVFDPNPCFNIYQIAQMCPLVYDVLTFPTQLVYNPPGAPTTYFNRSDVKAALHVPDSIDWMGCSDDPVYVGGNAGPQGEGDLSLDPIQHVLPQVIEATNRVLVSNGDFDMIIITNGTLLAIQNMTWNGELGFQTAPSEPINIELPDLQYAQVFADNGVDGWDGPQGIMGTQHYERGLMWAQSNQAGHMQPEFQPRLTYRHLQWVLGRIDTL